LKDAIKSDFAWPWVKRVVFYNHLCFCTKVIKCSKKLSSGTTRNHVIALKLDGPKFLTSAKYLTFFIFSRLLCKVLFCNTLQLDFSQCCVTFSLMLTNFQHVKKDSSIFVILSICHLWHITWEYYNLSDYKQLWIWV